MKNIYLVLIVLAITLVGCQSEDVNSLDNESELSDNFDVASLRDKAYISTTPAMERVAYTNYHLLNLAKAVNNANPEFVKMFDGKIDKDGEATMTFQEIFNSSASKGSPDENTQFSLDAFMGVSEENLVPSIRMVKDGKINDPIILLVSYDVDKGQKFCYGYEFNDEGELKMFSDNFKEEDITGEINSKINGRTALFLEPISECETALAKCSGGGGGGGGTGGGSSSRVLKIDRFKVTATNETWPARPEIKIKGYLVNRSTDDDCGDAQRVDSSVGCNDRRGKFLARIKRRHVGDNIGVNFTVDSNSASYGPSTKDYAFVMYEYDGFPAGIASALPYGSVSSFNIQYRSWENSYATDAIRENQLYGNPNLPLVSTGRIRTTNFRGRAGEIRFVGN